MTENNSKNNCLAKWCGYKGMRAQCCGVVRRSNSTAWRRTDYSFGKCAQSGLILSTEFPKGGPRATVPKGLTLEEALQCWSEPEKLERLAALRPYYVMPRRPTGPEEEQLQQDYQDLRSELEDELIAKLRRGELQATGIQFPPGPKPRREFITAETWEFVDVDFEQSDIIDSSGTTRWVKVEVIGPKVAKASRIPGDENTTAPAIRPIRFAVDRSARQIVFSAGPVLTGAAYNLFTALLVEFEADQENGLPPTQQRFVSPGVLETRLTVDQQTVRQSVKRVRNGLSEQFLSLAGTRLDQHDVIESQGRQGYRLNPRLMKVTLAQARADRGALSHDHA